jgi:hypothetical protein
MDRSRIIQLISAAVAAISLATGSAFAYPPAVGILSKSRSCLSCHVSAGPWSDEARTVIELLDAETKKSLQVADGTFQIQVPRGEVRTVLTVIGRRSGDADVPRRNAWLYVDPTRIETSALSKFSPGWDVNLPMACRIVGDRLEGYEGGHLTVLPMTIRPTDAAGDAELELQVMLTAGEAVKGQGKEGMVGNYFTRKVLLKVVD